MARKKRGTPIGGQFTPLLHQVLDCEAWRSLSPIARLVYIALRRRARPETNGTVFLSIRDAETECGVHRNSAALAFRDLQAAGFIIPTQMAHLGVEGRGKATTWRLTEIGTPGNPRPTKEFLTWSPSSELPVVKAARPASKKQNPVTNNVHPCHSRCDVSGKPVTADVTPCHSRCDVSGDFGPEPVTKFVPHLESTIRGCR